MGGISGIKRRRAPSSDDDIAKRARKPCLLLDLGTELLDQICTYLVEEHGVFVERKKVLLDIDSQDCADPARTLENSLRSFTMSCRRLHSIGVRHLFRNVVWRIPQTLPDIARTSMVDLFNKFTQRLHLLVADEGEAQSIIRTILDGLDWKLLEPLVFIKGSVLGRTS
ncbi:hypothetical protein BDV96DRAFT_652160 [Lophiotrema nucula]|uniref:Uncharacterized protein n=1 Tax=Lophiotrema nucula TaxID=690887 RepID=A0A6A5YQD5_9PLEO|nr:hypothetical protein BDV96DRAFT_652160 [Lophiotrema nucula]